MNDFLMKPDDLIFYQDGDKTKSLGFEIKNKYLNKMPAIIRCGNQQSSFAVPAGLFLIHKTVNSMTNNSQIPIEDVSFISENGEHENIEHDLYTRLLKLIEPTKLSMLPKQSTRSKRAKSATHSKSPTHSKSHREERR